MISKLGGYFLRILRTSNATGYIDQHGCGYKISALFCTIGQRVVLYGHVLSTENKDML